MGADIRTTRLYSRALAALYAGNIGDAMGGPTENKSPAEIEKAHGWLADFDSGGTDDTILRDLLAEALIRTGGYATLDDWAKVWLERWDDIFGPKVTRFFLSVLHTARKLKILGEPRMAALGNIPCSSSAMGIAPVGIVNACNPRQAVLQAYNLSSLINTYDSAFVQDGAAAIAAAVAAALDEAATVDSILEASTAYLDEIGGAKIRGAIRRALEVSAEAGEYRKFRRFVYDHAEEFLEPRKMNSRETVPITLALFRLAQGDPEKTITYGANFGRDADTMAAMGGAIAGAFRGMDAMPARWVSKVAGLAQVPPETLAEGLVRAAISRHHAEAEAAGRFARLVS
jgi:ADP-ribosylglycohydrolase